MNQYPAKYLEMLDEQIQAFINKTNDCYPEQATDERPSADEQRRQYSEMCRQFAAPRPDGVVAVDSMLEARDGFAIPVRRYSLTGTTPEAIIIYYHGGGFVVGDLESHDGVCAEFCAATGFDVVAVDYRMATEYRFPVAFNDCLRVFEQVSAESDLPVVLAGDSAGGNLAAGVSHMTRGSDLRPVGQLLIYPALGGDFSLKSYTEHAEAPGLTTDDMLYYYQAYTGKTEYLKDARINPLSDADFSGLPDTVIITADCDPLRDDAEQYQQRMQAAGGQVEWVNELGLVHGYLRARHSADLAKRSFQTMIDRLQVLAAQ